MGARTKQDARWALTRLVACLMLSGLLGAAPAWGRTDEKVLRLAILREFEPLHPLLQRQRATAYLGGFVNRHLFSYGHNGELQADLVTSVPDRLMGTEGLSPEPRAGSVSLSLREGALWGDGRPLDGYDVRFSWQVGRSLPLAPELAEVYANIVAVSVHPSEPKKFTLHLARLNRQTLEALAHLRILPQHVEEGAFTPHHPEGDAYPRFSFYNLQPTHEGLYNGPFLVREFLPGNRVVLTRNANFYGNKPLLDRIEVKFFHHLGDLERALAEGKLDLVVPLGIDLDTLAFFEGIIKRHRLPWQIAYYPSLIYEQVVLKQTHPILSDVRVRRALHYGIDKGQLLKQLFDDKYYLAHHFISPLDQWYPRDSSKVNFYPYAPRKAEALLTEAGWIMQRDGYRWRQGKKLQLPIISNEELSYRSQVVAFLKDEWQRLGVELLPKTEPAAVYFTETLKKGKFSAMALFATEKPLHYIPRAQFHSTEIPSMANGYSGENTSYWANPKVDGLLDSLTQEWDASRCQDLMEQLVRWYTTELPALPLFYRSLAAVKSSQLVGYHVSGHATPETYRSEYWSLQDP